jgi:hypothetical protein
MAATKALDSAKSLVDRARVEVGRRRRFGERHSFDDRSSGAKSLVLVIGGHKPQLWPYTLPRIARAVPDGVDVCLVTPGVDSPELRALAAGSGWSYMSTQGGHVSVAQNLVIAAHPHARMIHKIDEDMFVSDGFFAAMASGYERVAAEAEYDIGYVAPTINVNGFSFLEYVREHGLEEEWTRRFGRPVRAHEGTPAQRDGDAAVWLWESGTPVDDVSRRFAQRPFGYRIVPHRFSIGSILFERGLWEEMQGFMRRLPAPGLGEDEHQIAVACLGRSRIIAVLDSVYAGHFAFGPQTPAMLAAYGDRLADF